MTRASLTRLFDDVRSSGVPSVELFATVRELARIRLLKRGLLEKPPALLGYPFARWEPPRRAQADEGALDALAADAVDATILKKMSSLGARRDVGADIDGMIVQGIEWFVDDLQRRADPIQRNAWTCVSTSLRQGASEGWVTVLSGGSALRAETVVGSTGATSGRLTPADELRAALVRHAKFRAVLVELDRTSLDEEARARAVTALNEVLRNLSGGEIWVTRVGQLVTATAQEARALAGGAGPIPSGEEPLDEDAGAAGSPELRIVLMRDVELLEHAIRDATLAEDVRAARLRVLHAILGDPDASDADLAPIVSLDRRRVWEHRKALQKLANRSPRTPGQSPPRRR